MNHHNIYEYSKQINTSAKRIRSIGFLKKLQHIRGGNKPFNNPIQALGDLAV
jgi:hypothetical protein